MYEASTDKCRSKKGSTQRSALLKSLMATQPSPEEQLK